MEDHIRRDLMGKEVIISTTRAKRTDGLFGKAVKGKKSHCPFCPGHEDRTEKTILALPDEKKWQVRIFNNKFPVLKDKSFRSMGKYPYFSFTPRGQHEIMIETRSHNKEYEDMTVKNLALALRALKIRYEQLMCMKDINYVTIFKNKGEEAGASLRHTHTQIIASPIFPEVISKEMDEAETYFKKEKKCGFCTMVEQEMKRDERVVDYNAGWVCVTPYASYWPFELSFIPRRHFSELTDADEGELDDLARLMKNVFTALSKLFKDLPYNMMYHNFPKSELWHFHIKVYPRLVTHAGFEFFGLNVNIMPPEEATKDLKKAIKGNNSR
jgi:UDPglucose--hexose-1-phosphate uridylyltransferase